MHQKGAYLLLRRLTLTLSYDGDINALAVTPQGT